MATTTTEYTTLISVSTGEAVRSVGELRDNIKALKEQLNAAEIGTEDYQDTLRELKVNQAALRDAMHASTATMEDIEKAANGIGVSYNALVARMAELKQEFRATSDEAKRVNLGAQINEINSQLKALDALQGNFQRNVGNYLGAADRIIAAFSGMGSGAAAMINPIKNVTLGLKALSQTPVIAILGALVSVVSKVIDSLKSSEETMNALKTAFAVFEPIGDAVTRVIQLLGKAIATAVGWLSQLAAKMGTVTEMARERMEIAEAEIRLTKQQRETTMANADAELEVAELRAKAAEKSKYSAQERLDFLRAAAEKEAEISARAVEAAELEYDIIRRRNALTESSTEELNEEAAAYAKMVKAKTDYANSIRSLNRQISTEEAAIASERKAAAEARAKAAEEEARAVEKAAAEEERARKEAAARAEAAERDLLERRIALAESGSDEELTLRLELLEREYRAELKTASEEIENERTRTLTLLAIEEQYRRDRTALGEEYDTAWAAAEAERLRVESEAEAERVEAGRQRLENRMNALAANSAEYLEAALELRRYELDTLARLEEESDEEFYARKLEREKAYLEAKKALQQRQVEITQAGVSATANILTSLADYYEADTDASEKELKRAKNMKIAAATITTLGGAISAYMGSIEAYGIPWGMILGAINSAAVLAAGMAQVAKIRATDTSGDSSSTSSSSSSSSSAVATPSITTTITSVRNLTGASEEERLNRVVSAATAESRVVLVTSELEAKQAAARVRLRESTF